MAGQRPRLLHPSWHKIGRGQLPPPVQGHHRGAGLGKNWTPQELRHTFVSLLSADGTPVEEIARLAGNSSTCTTEVIYRRELRPVLTSGAEAMYNNPELIVRF
jgi:site-specific recombinase XerD